MKYVFSSELMSPTYKMIIHDFISQHQKLIHSRGLLEATQDQVDINAFYQIEIMLIRKEIAKLQLWTF